MRACLTFFLAVLLSLNTAYAAVSGVCDALEHTQQSNTAHFGHHSHDHADGHMHDTPPTDTDGADQATAASDHHHAHVHPGFSTLLPGSVAVMALGGRSPLVAATLNTFVSAVQVRLDRPPRAALA